MNYTREEVLQFVSEEDVKFIRLAFCDVFGHQKNISIMPEELPRAFSDGIAFDASAVRGFGDEAHSDLLLHPDPATLVPLPWRPEHGRVMRMFCSISYPSGAPFECDTRTLLINAASDAASRGYPFRFGSEQEFYLFELDENGEPTEKPYDHAGYMDIAPDDRGENIRREICLTLEQMGIRTESSHHEEGPGQNEIDFRYSDPVTAADQTLTFQTIVKTVARRNGLYADFSPKPLSGFPGNGFHINMSIHGQGEESLYHLTAGVLKRISEMTVFLNPSERSYLRLGQKKAPGYLSWSHENRSQLIRIPAASGEYRRMELRSPDPLSNPYLAFTLLIRAGLEGLEGKLTPPPPANINLFKAAPEELSHYQKLPSSLEEAQAAAVSSTFLKEYVPEIILNLYTGR